MVKLWLANFVMFGTLFVLGALTAGGDGNPYVAPIVAVIGAILMASFLKWRQIPSAANRWFGETSRVQRPWIALTIYTASTIVAVTAIWILAETFM